MNKMRMLILAGVSLLPGFVKRPIYRWFFRAEIGADVTIGFGAILIFDRMTIGTGARIGVFNLVRVFELTMDNRARIGSFVKVACHSFRMGSASTISSSVNILADHRDPRSTFAMGPESWVLEFCYINPARAITLGRNVGVGGGSYIFAHGLWLSKLDGYPVSFGPVSIGDNVWLPWGCFIMPGVEIGAGAVVGARSLVTKSLAAGVLAAGSPARVIREQVAIPLSIDAKNTVLLDATREFAEYAGLKLKLEERNGWMRCCLGGEPLFALAKDSDLTPPISQSGHELAVVHTDYRSAASRHSCVFSLTTYQSSRYDAIGPLQRRWLAHLRLIGLRYYPIDEVDVEGSD